MKIRLIVLALLALRTASYADFIEDNPAPFSANVPITLGRHHISIGLLGTFQSTSGDFEIPELGLDGSKGSPGFLNYRYSFTREIDLAADMHLWISEIEYLGWKLETTASGFGIGVRYNLPAGKLVFPYVQLNAYSVSEDIRLSYGSYSISDRVGDSEEEIGFGANAGVEIRLGKLISIPIDVMYLYGKPADDISGYGVSTGISFNWGQIE